MANFSGTTGNDTIRGSGGADNINGRQGNDYIQGGGGNDVIVGAAGTDILRGGAGEDTFVFRRGDGEDYIRDFDPVVDGLRFVGISQREVVLIETDTGTTVRYGGPAGMGPNPGEIHIDGVTAQQLAAADWSFT